MSNFVSRIGNIYLCMKTPSAKLTRNAYNWIFSLSRKQTAMLKGKDVALAELYDLCDNDIQRNLIRDLIIRFHCFDEEIYNLALMQIVEYISNLGYNIQNTAIVAFCHDSSADSSQEILQDLKVPITKRLNYTIKTINRFDRIQKAYNSGYRHFIAVDEFLGSGQTICNRYKDFSGKNLKDATIDFCLVAGMSDAISYARGKGINVYVAYEMQKGISYYYKGTELDTNKKEMSLLESKLADTINMTNLNDYLFGYGQSEALYSRLYKNVPNNVFPIMWWKYYKDHTNRNTLFDRAQDGY